MNDYSDYVMLALLPTTSDWCRQELPHVTLVYAGKVQDLPKSAFNEMAKDASSLSMMMRPFVLRVTGLDVFGDADERVDVLRLQPSPELLAMRRFVERWNKSEYPFNPHATIGPAGGPRMPVPQMLGFNRIFLSYGTDDLTFRLND